MPQAPEAGSDQPSPHPGLSPFYQNQARIGDLGTTRHSKRKSKNAPGREEAGAKDVGKTSHNNVTQSPHSLRPRPSDNPRSPSFEPSDKQVTSPLLEALGSIGAAYDHEASSRTDAWARSIPFGRGPSSDAEEAMNAANSPPSAPRPIGRGGFATASPPASPPQRMVRPVSQSNLYGRSADSRDTSRDKRNSFGTNYSQNPPLPHLPQAHFYGAPNIDLGILSKSQAKEHAEAGYPLHIFDSLPLGATSASQQLVNVVILGGEGSLQVLAIETERLKPVGRLESVSGTIIDAKILPWNSRVDPFETLRPLVAVTVHGPAEEMSSDDPEVSGNVTDMNGGPDEGLPGISSSASVSGNSQRGESNNQFQTRVEVYSLVSGSRVAVLFASRPVPAGGEFSLSYISAPSPVGDLKIHTAGNLIIVSSGTSGEVFVFGIECSAEGSQFQCLGKVWTSIQSSDNRRYSSSSNSTDTDGSPIGFSHGPRPSNSAILSLSGRWLAILPPTPSMRFSLYGKVPYSLSPRKRPGLDSHTSNSKPGTTCIIDSPEPESMLNKVAREVTQELVKGAGWLREQGMQTLRNYWNRDLSTASSQSRNARHSDPPQSAPFFPPTHAAENVVSSPNSDPDLVSVYDLRRFEEFPDLKTVLTPVATFQPPNGCSFLSFAPNGLSLLTASKKGDVYYVWDLMQMAHCRASALMSDTSATGAANTTLATLRVRQIAKFERNSPSRIADVIWEPPIGERIAILTKKGTVHLFDLPLSAFQWPPFRRVARPPTTASESNDSALKEGKPDEPPPTSNPFAAAMNIVGGRTQPLFAAVRGRAPSLGNPFPGAGGLAMGSSTGIKAGKAVAAGLSKSAGAATNTVSNIRRAGENRLHLPGLVKSPSTAQVVWFGYGEDSSIGVIEGNAFKSYRVSRSPISGKGTRRRPSIFSSKSVEIRLPVVIDGLKVPVAGGEFVQKNQDRSLRKISNQAKNLSSHPLSHAEIETNPPYQPFHTDRRVGLHIYADAPDPGASERNHNTWIFGSHIPCTTLHVWDSVRDDHENDLLNGPVSATQVENSVSIGEAGEDGAVEQVVVTTRRRKGPAGATGSTAQLPEDDGFFEDDCTVVDFAGDRV